MKENKINFNKERNKILEEIRKERVFRALIDTSEIYQNSLDRLVHYHGNEYLELKYHNRLDLISRVYEEICGIKATKDLDENVLKELHFIKD